MFVSYKDRGNRSRIDTMIRQALLNFLSGETTVDEQPLTSGLNERTIGFAT
jgi:hypothetical protein